MSNLRLINETSASNVANVSITDVFTAVLDLLMLVEVLLLQVIMTTLHKLLEVMVRLGKIKAQQKLSYQQFLMMILYKKVMVVLHTYSIHTLVQVILLLYGKTVQQVQ
jgi:tetrahydromethanopterin S-methyltransferase subunit E